MWLSNLTFKNTTHKYYTHISTNSCYTFSIYTSVLHCCDLICDTYLFKLFIFCVEWNGSFGFSNSTRSRSSVDYLYIWKSRSIFFLEIIAKKNCFASMLLALFRIFWIRNELLWICLIILQKALARKNPKIAIALETLPLLSPPLIAIDDHYPKGIWFIPPWLFFFQMMLPSFTWPQKLVFYWYQLFLFVKAALNLPNVVFFPTAMLCTTPLLLFCLESDRGLNYKLQFCN